MLPTKCHRGIPFGLKSNKPDSANGVQNNSNNNNNNNNNKILCLRGCRQIKFFVSPKCVIFLTIAITIKISQNGDFWEEMVSENDFEAVWATFCCYDHDAKASEAVLSCRSKRVSQMLLVLNSQNIPIINQQNSEKWLVKRILPT